MQKTSNLSKIQGHLWNQQQCTLQPVVITTESQPMYCFKSDNLVHNVGFVYVMCNEKNCHTCTRNVLRYKKKSTIFLMVVLASTKIANIFKIYAEDFGMKCEWNFFAALHGKPPID